MTADIKLANQPTNQRDDGCGGAEAPGSIFGRASTTSTNLQIATL
jgi:hypothetical protein